MTEGRARPAGWLDRLFRPRSIAIVGASETRPRFVNAFKAMQGQDIPIFLVNRNGDRIFGQPSYTSLTEIGEPVDAVFALVGAQAAIEVVRETTECGGGGVVVNAGGFPEAGADGAGLERRLITSAQGLPVLGPNCNGFLNVRRGIHLAGSPPFPVDPGGIGFVTHSGATMLPMAIAGRDRGIGFSYLVSTGNEAVVDVADCIDFLAQDADTVAIALLIETIRRPDAFFAAVRRAIDGGKPVVALKNGRSERGMAIAQSHTGALAGDAWLYNAAFRQHGIVMANDLVDLADRVVLFDLVPKTRWSGVKGLAVAAGSGGWVTMASDVAAEEGIALPELEDARGDLQGILPGAPIVNPLDLTGAGMTNPAIARAVLNLYARHPRVDTILMQSPVSDGFETLTNAFIRPALDLALTTDKLVIAGSVEGGPIGPLLKQDVGGRIALTKGVRATMRALRTMGDFMAFSPAHDAPVRAVDELPRPTGNFDHPKVGTMLRFDAAMTLLEQAGVPVAPWHIVEIGDDIGAPRFPGPYVVKLADVPHRTDLGAVRLDVGLTDLSPAIDDLRILALEHGESPRVVIQPMLRIESELLIGINAASPLGPFVICGPGGILVEMIGGIAGRVAPFGEEQATGIVSEVNAKGYLDGPRGSLAWDKKALSELLVSVGRLANATQNWLTSFDINPLVLTPQGMFAVDGLSLLRAPAPLFADDPQQQTTNNNIE